MEYSFEDAKDSFDLYIEHCKEMLIKTFFTRDSVKVGIVSSIKSNDLSPEEVNDRITKHRLNLINIKVDHTMRMVKQIVEINRVLDVRFDFGLILKNAVLFHDIGRFSQALRGDTFTDSVFYGPDSLVANGFVSHADEGASVYLNEKFAVDDAYKWTVSQSIKYHDVPNDSTNPNTKFLDADKVASFSFDNVLNGPINPKTVKQMNSSEILAYSLITQLVADIDKADILYQCANATFERGMNGMLVRDYVEDRSRDSLENVAKYWEISKDDIIQINTSFNEKQYEIDRFDLKKNVSIRIPIEKIDISKLKISDDFMYMLKNNSWSGSSERGGLAELQKRTDWNFLTIFLWRLGKFICDINVTSVLKTMDEIQLLDELKTKFISMGNEMIGVDGKPMGEALFSLVEEGYNFVYDLLKERVYANRNNVIIEDKRIVR